MGSDSENEDVEFDAPSSDAEEEEEADVEDDLLEAVEGASSDASEAEHEEYSDDDEDEDEEDEEPRPSQPAPAPAPVPQSNPPPAPRPVISSRATNEPPPQRATKSPSPPLSAARPVSPAGLRRLEILSSIRHPRTYTVEAIAAIPHPTPTHSLASSLCLTHLFTGSEDGYVRDYDVYTAANSKNFLSTAQRSHCGVIEGTMKAGHLRYWWENPAEPPRPTPQGAPAEEVPLAPIYSIVSHSDALWTLTGSSFGRVNLFTARHAPGTLIHSFEAHKGPVSSMCLDLGETGLYTAGWDGVALQWDLNTGQFVRSFAAHGSQIAAVAVRPLATPALPRSPSPDAAAAPAPAAAPMAVDDPVKAEHEHELFTLPPDGGSDNGDFDPLFDEAQDGDIFPPGALLDEPTPAAALPSLPWAGVAPAAPRLAPKMPPLLDAGTAPTLSADLLMTASIDGQVVLWDQRVGGTGVGRLEMNSGTPPWCVSACWSANGAQIYAGRRNGTIDVWDVRHLGSTGPRRTPRLLKTIRNPPSSGMVACVVAFPDGKHIACASNDNIRLWNVAEAGESSGRGVQFKIVPGHHGGFVSQMLVDPAARFLVSASSDRGWGWGESSRTIFVHDIKHVT